MLFQVADLKTSSTANLLKVPKEVTAGGGIYQQDSRPEAVVHERVSDIVRHRSTTELEVEEGN